MRIPFATPILLALGAVAAMGTIVACGDNALGVIPDANLDASSDAGPGPGPGPVDGGIVDSGEADAAKPPAPQYTISGTVTGLTGAGLILANGAEKLTIAKDATTFSFATKVTAGGTYTVTTDTQPTGPSQTCVVTNGSGTATANVTNVAVNCTTNTYDISVNVAGAEGSGLVLQNNGGDDLTVTPGDAGTQKTTFATKVASGQSFDVTIKTQPSSPDQFCAVAGGSGTVESGNVESITVNCTKLYTVSGVVNGVTGNGLVLQINGGDDVPITAAGGFAFPTPLLDGATYEVKVKDGTNPTNPWQVCSVTSGGVGTISGNVTDVVVDCQTTQWAVSGTVTGLAGTGLVLTNGGEDIPMSADGSFKFNTPVLSGATYDVQVKTQPTGPWQTCTVTGGTGTITNANASVTVTCATNGYSVGGTVWGLRGTGLVLSANGVPLAPINAQGDFHVDLPSGANYTFTLDTQPSSPSQTCVLSKATGTVAGANVTDVTVGCTKAIVVGAASPQSWVDDVVTKLVSTGAFATVDNFNAYLNGTPTLAKIQEYDAMLLFSDYGFADPTTMGNIAADYFDGGGRVVITTFANASVPIGGRWVSGNYHLLSPGGQNSPTISAPVMIDEPNTWLTRNVSTLTATSAYMGTGSPINGGVTVARWGSGDHLIIRGEKNGRKYAALNFYPPSVNARADFWSGDGAQIMRNALTYQ